MKLNFFLILFLFSFSSVSSWSSGANLKDEKWVHITTKEGIDIFSKKTKASPIRSLRAEGLIDGPIEKVVAILRNVENATDWLPRLLSRTYVENISDTEAILHDISDMPWPVKDRDLIVHHSLVLSEDKKSLQLNFKSVTHPIKPEIKERVRATFHYGQILFTPKENKTHIRMIILVDPNGAIPKWMVNILQVSMPFDFLNALNKFAKKTDLKPLPGIQGLIDQLN